MGEKVAVFITAFNEGAVIGDILGQINEGFDVYVIDDGSTDRTAEIAKEAGARVVSHPINLGQGLAVITMFKIAVAIDYDFIVHIDGDGQHDPKDIPKFLEKMKETGADIVAGSRLLGSNYEGAPLSRRMLLSPLTWVLNKLTGYNISDSMCGFRAFRGEVLKKITPILDEMVETEYLASEMWIRFARAGLTATEVPINLSARKHGSSYKGHALARYGLGIIRTIFRAKLDTYKARDPK